MAYPQYSEQFDFTGNVKDDANWNVLKNSTAEVTTTGTDYVKMPSESNKAGICIHQTAADTLTQCVRIEVRTVAGAGGTVGAILRGAAADGTGDHYECTCRYSGSAWEFSVEISNGLSFTELVGTRNSITAPNSGDWFGFSVEGTGASTQFKFWDFGASDPGEYSTWGAETSLEEGDPVTAIDTGYYTGIRFYTSSPAKLHEVDTWYGGDTAAAAGGISIPVAMNHYKQMRR